MGLTDGKRRTWRRNHGVRQVRNSSPAFAGRKTKSVAQVFSRRTVRRRHQVRTAKEKKTSALHRCDRQHSRTSRPRLQFTPPRIGFRQIKRPECPERICRCGSILAARNVDGIAQQRAAEIRRWARHRWQRMPLNPVADLYEEKCVRIIIGAVAPAKAGDARRSGQRNSIAQRMWQLCICHLPGRVRPVEHKNLIIPRLLCSGPRAASWKVCTARCDESITADTRERSSKTEVARQWRQLLPLQRITSLSSRSPEAETNSHQNPAQSGETDAPVANNLNRHFESWHSAHLSGADVIMPKGDAGNPAELIKLRAGSGKGCQP